MSNQDKYLFKITAYPQEAKNLVDVWVAYMNNSLRDEFVVFRVRQPKNPKSDSRRIGGISAQCVSYLQDDTELVKMSVENFILLMAKAGVVMEVRRCEVEEEAKP